MSNDERTTGRMVYGKESFAGRAKQLDEAYGIGVKVILGVLTTAFLGSEWNRIRNLRPRPTNYLYLALLLATVAMVGGWIIFSKMDLDALKDWLDPENYEAPSEVVVILAISVILALLLLAARDAAFFGAAYVLYAAANLAASRHMRNEFVIALQGSRKRLDRDRGHVELAPAVAIYEEALTALEKFVVVRPNLTRLVVVLGLASVGLALSIYSRVTHGATSEIAAYIIYLLALVVLDIALMVAWRQSLYNQLRTLAAARYELSRARAGPSDSANH